MYQEIMLAVIVSLDLFLVSVSYCNSGIKIPLSSATVITVTGSIVLWTAIKFSTALSNYISTDMCNILGTVIMTAIGLLTIIKSLVRNLTRLLSRNGEMSLKVRNAGLIVKLYLDDTAADLDHSKTLSPAEAAALAVAGSLDSAAAGLSCGFVLSPVPTAIFALIMGFIAIIAGSITGKKISSLNQDFSWVGGILIIIFAFFGI